MIEQLTPSPRNDKVPFRGKPVTKFRLDRAGDLTVTVNARALHPFVLKLIRWTAVTGSALTLGIGCYGLAVNPYPTWGDAAAVPAITAFTYPALRYSLGYLLQFRTPVRITKDEVSFKRFLFWKTFERRHPHSFVLLRHDDTNAEKERIAFRNSKKPRKFWFLRRRTYYDDSYHVCLEYFGERQDIITVYGFKKAQKIHARLMACDDVVEGHAHGDGGVVLSPETDWRNTTGLV